MPDTGDQIKGSATIATRDWLDERLGADWFTTTIRKYDPTWPVRLLPGDWYPLRPQLPALERARLRLAKVHAVEDIVEQVAGLIAVKDLTSIHRAFLWSNNPQTFLRAVPIVWGTYARFGSIGDTDNATHHYTARLSEIPADLMPWTMGFWRGIFPAALVFTGGDEPVAEVDEQKPGAGGSWSFRYQLRYR